MGRTESSRYQHWIEKAIELSEDLRQIVMAIVPRLLGAGVVLLIVRALAGLAHRWPTRSLEKAGLTPSLVTLLTTLGFQKDIAERAMQGFDKAGIVIPRPQQEVHLVNCQQ
jgi:hypothetical protein